VKNGAFYKKNYISISERYLKLKLKKYVNYLSLQLIILLIILIIIILYKYQTKIE